MTFLERYQAGECQQVWHDLRALGPDVRARKIRDDAEAVARETMRRARHNLRILIPRLQAAGYQFHQPDPLKFARRTAADKRKKLEKKINGRLPLSLAAWWDAFFSVSFAGTHPELEGLRSDPLIFFPIEDALAQLEDWHPTPPFYPPPGAWQTSIEAWRRQLRAQGVSPEETEARMAEAIAGFEAQDRENEALRAVPFDPRFRFAFAPDELTKAEVRGGTYDVLLPHPEADCVLENADGAPWFVDYLRESLHRGGFRGLENGPPILSGITAGLLPL